MVDKSKPKPPAPQASGATVPETDLPGTGTDAYSEKLIEQFATAFGQQPYPGVDTARILETILKNMAVLSTANRHIYQNAEAAMIRQGKILKQTLQEASAAVDALANVSSPQELAERQADLLRRILLQTLDHMRQEAKTTLKSSNEAFAEAFTTINSRVINNIREITELIKQLEK